MTERNPEYNPPNAQAVIDRHVSRRWLMRTGASAAGGLALGSMAVPAAATPNGKGELRPPVPVLDRDDPDPDPAIVVAGLDVPISDWVVFGSETVADQNPSYDPDDRVVIVAFERLLDDGWPDWRRATPAELFDGVVARGVKFHAFPQARLLRGRSTGNGHRG